MNATTPREATCVGCGCTDSHACPHGCSWLAVNRSDGTGVCSNCLCALDDWREQQARDAGKKNPPIDADWQLQVNNSGAWKTVVRFDPRDRVQMACARDGAAILYRIDPAFKWRIATGDGTQQVLERLDRNTGGTWQNEAARHG